MISLSKTDLEALTYLVRNFSQKLTVSQLAKKLKVTAPGLHQGLKKLEQAQLLKKLRLGTGLFYEVNYTNEAACSLAAFLLSLTPPTIATDLPLLLKGKRVLAISNKPLELSGYDTSTLTLTDFTQKLREKDEDILDMIRTGTIQGAHTIVQAIKEATPKW